MKPTINVIVFESEPFNTPEMSLYIKGKRVTEWAVVSVDKDEYPTMSTEGVAKMVSVGVETLEERKRSCESPLS